MGMRFEMRDVQENHAPFDNVKTGLEEANGFGPHAPVARSSLERIQE